MHNDSKHAATNSVQDPRRARRQVLYNSRNGEECMHESKDDVDESKAEYSNRKDLKTCESEVESNEREDDASWDPSSGGDGDEDGCDCEIIAGGGFVEGG